MNHVDYMMQCIQLAKAGRGWVNPNPMVGALLVCDGEIISEGYHRAFGEPHAEPNAILAVKDLQLLQKATLYVSLEPCSHFGKTPPCADLIVQSKIPRVVVAMRDPNPQVAGRGIARLRAAGIEVVEGVCEAEARQLNRFFLKFHEQKRPFFIAKWAETQNGFIAPIPKREAFISGEDTRFFSHALRQEVMAVLVGVGTWEIDRPNLNDRYHGGPQPIRIIWDPHFKGNYEQAMSEEALTWVITETATLQSGNVQVFALPQMTQNLDSFFEFCEQKGLNSILIEGGAKTLSLFINADCIDEIYRFQNRNLVWENGLPAPQLTGASFQLVKSFEHSDLYVYNLDNPTNL